MPTSHSTQPIAACPRCNSKFTIKKGRRLNRFRILQVFQCRECLYKFTAAAGKNKTYPPRVIFETVSTYNLGNSISETQSTVRKRLHVDVPEGTIRSWIRAHKPLTAYTRLRAIGRKRFDAETMIRSYLLRHKQVYRFQLHRAKIELLLQTARHRHLAPAKDYLEAIGQDFPHRMFQTTEHRSSKFPTRLSTPIVRKENYATRLAALGLPTAAAYKTALPNIIRFSFPTARPTTTPEHPRNLTAARKPNYRATALNSTSLINSVTCL